MRRAFLIFTAALVLAAPARAADGPHRGTEAMLRQRIAELAAGRLDFSTISEEIAAAARPELPAIQEQLEALGTVESVTFRDVDRLGSDVYDVRFKHGSQTWVIRIGPDGRANVLLFQPA
jgi:hypothetical protein